MQTKNLNILKKPLAKWICSILDKKGELNTREIEKEIRIRYPVEDRFSKGLNYRTILDYLNQLDENEIIEKNIKGKNIAYWKLIKKAISPELLIAERDKEMIDVFSNYPDRIKSDYGITIYGFPKELLDKDSIPKFDKILNKIRDASYQMRDLSLKVYGNYVNELEKTISNKLDKEIFIIYHSLFLKYEGNLGILSKWYDPPYCPETIKPTLGLVKIFKKMFYPSKRNDEIYKMLKDHRISKEVSIRSLKLALFFRLLPMEKLTIVAHTPSVMDVACDLSIIKKYRKEMEILGLSKNFDELDNLVKKHYDNTMNKIKKKNWRKMQSQ